MRSRAAILPYPGDPILLNYWLHSFKHIWYDEIDNLYIMANTSIGEPAKSYIMSICDDPKITLSYMPHQTDHGIEIKRGLEMTREEFIVLLEDDGFIFQPGALEMGFKWLEMGQADIAASKRGSCSFEILEKAKEVFKLDYEGVGDQGPNFWPCFFFSKKKLLLDTDCNFCAKQWTKGEKIEGLDWVVDCDVVVGDTFVNTSLQLRAMVPDNRIFYHRQYHGSPDDLKHYEQRRYLFDGFAKWVHVGSLSTGVAGVLMDDDGRPLANPEAEKKPAILGDYCKSSGEQLEWERRVSFWLMFAIFFSKHDYPESMRPFIEQYTRAIYRIIKQYKLNYGKIKRQIAVYHKLGLW